MAILNYTKTANNVDIKNAIRKILKFQVFILEIIEK